MMDFLSHFWAWLSSAFAVGALTALFSRSPTRHGGVARWLVWFGFAFAAGVPVVMLRLLSGRNAVYLESGLAIFVVFIAGCGIGAALGRRPLRHNEAWALGLVPIALIWLASNHFALRNLEAELSRKVAASMERMEGSRLGFEVAGRDVILPKDPDGTRLAGEIERVPGVRRVVSDGTVGPAEHRSEHAAAGNAARNEPPIGAADPGSEKRREMAGVPEASAPTAAQEPEGNPPPEEEKGRGAAAVLAALPPSGQLDPATCQAALSATLDLEEIQFRDKSPVIRRVSSGLMEKLTLLLKRCPDVKVQIAAYADADGHGRGKAELSRLRAERVADYLVRMGVERSRLEPVGYAPDKSPAAAGALERLPRSARVEFVVQRRR